MTGRITAERLRELLDYNQETGVLTWRVRKANRVRVGDVAGWIGGQGYISISIDDRTFRAHRLAWLWMTGEWPKAEIDHINCDKADNRWNNLREATDSQNRANAHIPTSGFKGVYWDRHELKWRTDIKLNGKTKTLGRFDTRERAFIAYMMAAWRIFGDYARIDADYLVELRRLRARKALVLWNLARPDYLT